MDKRYICIKDQIQNMNLVISCTVGCPYCYARNNVRAKHYHVTFEPLFDDPGKVDFSGIDWVVIGTMTGPMSRKVRTSPEWVHSLTEQAHAQGARVFWKEDLAPIMGEDMIQELPDAYNTVLEEQKKWHK